MNKGEKRRKNCIRYGYEHKHTHMRRSTKKKSSKRNTYEKYACQTPLFNQLEQCNSLFVQFIKGNWAILWHRIYIYFLIKHGNTSQQIHCKHSPQEKKIFILFLSFVSSLCFYQRKIKNEKKKPLTSRCVQSGNMHICISGTMLKMNFFEESIFTKAPENMKVAAATTTSVEY